MTRVIIHPSYKQGAYRALLRAQGRQTGYQTALDWFRRLPAHELERRLTEKVAEVAVEIEEARKVLAK